MNSFKAFVSGKKSINEEELCEAFDAATGILTKKKKDYDINALFADTGVLKNKTALFLKAQEMYGIKLSTADIKEIVDSGFVTMKGRSLILMNNKPSSIKTKDAKSLAKKAKRDSKKAPLDIGQAKDVFDDAEASTSGATKVKDLSKGKLKKLKIPALTRGSSKVEMLAKKIILNALDDTNIRMILTGDPGTGKSRISEQVITLLKMKVITIEAPHVSEDSIINIPYLIRTGDKVEEFKDEYLQTATGFEVVNAESNLVTRLKLMRPMKDIEYNNFLKKNKALAPLAEKLKGPINKVSAKYTTCLFLDEFYRTGSARIQNLFRTILNGNIGNTPIPKNVYILFASNVDNSDGTLDDIPMNHQFNKINFDTPTPDEFMRYIADRFTNTDVNTGEEDDVQKTESNINIQPEVYNKFAESLKKEEMGVPDEDTESRIRVSPRRWEEIIKYINANVPTDKRGARALKSFLKNNLTDYRTNETSKLYKKYVKVLGEILEETSGINIDDIAIYSKSEWKDSLFSEISTKIKLGDDRKYVPIISGKPGIGKTTIIRQIAKEHNLKLINLDASTLNADDVIGLSVPEGEGKNLTTKFSKPALYTNIMKDFDKSLKPADNGKYTHLLFIDELSRVQNKKVFNSIRALMLDKKVGQEKIDDRIMIICAMNPFDSGTESLSEHMIDVVDVIDAEADYNSVLNYLKGSNKAKYIKESIGFDLTTQIINIHRIITEAFESEFDIEQEPINDMNTRKFFWTAGIETFYVSAREFDAIILGSAMDTTNALLEFEDYKLGEKYTEEDYQYFTDIVIDNIKSKYEEVLSFITEQKMGMEHQNFAKIMITVNDIIDSQRSEIYDGFSELKSEAITTIKSIFEGSKYDIDMLMDTPDIGSIFDNAIKNSDADTVINDVSDIINNIKVNGTVVEQVETVIKLYKLLSKVNWSLFSGDVSNTISIFFVEKVFVNAAKTLLEAMDNDDSVADGYMKAVESGKIDEDTLGFIFEKANKNNYNLFLDN